MDPDSALLWFSGTVLQSDKMLYDYVGRNEKTKVVLKVTDANSGPPQQPRLSEEDQRLMLLHTYKKAEELKVIPLKWISAINRGHLYIYFHLLQQTTSTVQYDIRKFIYHKFLLCKY